jgi:PAS domain S-box-containing protein
METSLREDRYKAFVENSLEGIWLVELDEPIPINLPAEKQIQLMYKHAYLAEANTTFAQMYSVESPEDMIGMRLGELLVQDDPLNIEYLRGFIASNYRLFGVDSREKDLEGNDKYFKNSLIGFVEDGMIYRAWGTQQDVTEQRTALEALKNSEEQLALALEASSTGIWKWDTKANTVSWSDGMKKIYGLTTDQEIDYEKYISLVHQEDRKAIQQAIEKAMLSGKEYTIEHRIIWPDHSVHWIMGRGKAYIENGAVVRMAGTALNIDERKQSQLKLEESEARFQAMADTAPVLIWLSGLDKLCFYFNKPWLDFTGRTTEQEFGNGWVEGVHPDDMERCIEIYTTSFDARKPFSMEYRLRRHDGEYRLLLDNGAPRFSKKGEFLGYIGSCTDIQDVKNTNLRKKQLEEVNIKLRQQRQQLVALNQSKDEFISLASHQLRTPATGVKQYLGILLDNYFGELTLAQRQALEVAYESNERQLNIINDLLRVAHIDSGKVVLNKADSDIKKLLQEVMEEQSDRFKTKHQKIIFRSGSKDTVANIDSNRLRMVLENLIDNAIKYTLEDRTIVIEIVSTKSHIAIKIIDEGIGISKEDMPKLFKKFSRIDNTLTSSISGTGLGLYWAKKIITLHEGTLTVDSTPLKGSTFTVRLPKSGQR